MLVRFVAADHILAYLAYRNVCEEFIPLKIRILKKNGVPGILRISQGSFREARHQ